MKCCYFFLLLLPFAGISQKQERQIAGYNIALGAISSGIGAVINKPKHSDWKRYFIKGAWQGSVGGLLSYSGKKTLYLINKKNEPGFGWPAKVLHAAGTSIIENAALNEPFLQNWNIDIGPVRLDFSINNKKPIRARFLPVSIYAVIMGASYGRFDWSKTLRSGTMTFYTNDQVEYQGNLYLGTSFGRSFIYSRLYRQDINRIITHETAHNFQYRDYMILNTWLKPLEKHVKSKGLQTIFSKYVYADIPYFMPVYLLEGFPDLNNNYYKNFFEFEAERIATNRYVPR